MKGHFLDHAVLDYITPKIVPERTIIRKRVQTRPYHFHIVPLPSCLSFFQHIRGLIFVSARTRAAVLQFKLPLNVTSSAKSTKSSFVKLSSYRSAPTLSYTSQLQQAQCDAIYRAELRIASSLYPKCKLHFLPYIHFIKHII